MDLASYLLKPVQRMGKYALILKQVRADCDPKNIFIHRFTVKRNVL